jgi:hypothetical protein
MKKGQTHSFSFIKSAMGTSKGTAAHVTPAYAHDQRVADKAARKAMSVKPGKSKW